MNMMKTIATVLTFATISLLAGCSHQPLSLNGLQPGMTLDAARAAAPASAALYCRGDGDANMDNEIDERTKGDAADPHRKDCIWSSAAWGVFPVWIGGRTSTSYFMSFITDKPATRTGRMSTADVLTFALRSDAIAQRLSSADALALASKGDDVPGMLMPDAAPIPDADWHLAVFRIDDMPRSAYQSVVTTLSAKLAKPTLHEHSNDGATPYVEAEWADDAGYLDVFQHQGDDDSQVVGVILAAHQKTGSNGKA
jgi:hypothetical protein